MVPSWRAGAKRPVRCSHRRSVGRLIARRHTVEAYQDASEQPCINILMAMKRPARKQGMRSGRVPVSPGMCQKDFHCFNRRALPAILAPVERRGSGCAALLACGLIGTAPPLLPHLLWQTRGAPTAGEPAAPTGDGQCHPSRLVCVVLGMVDHGQGRRRRLG